MPTTKRKHRSASPSSPSSPQKRKAKRKPCTLLDAIHNPPDLTARPLFQKARLKLHVAIPPAAAAVPSSLSTYMRSHLASTLLLKHTEHGTIVAFSDFSSLAGVGRILDECPFSWSWFEGDVVLFNPTIGQRINGTVVLSSPDHIALLTCALFNVSIPRIQLPKDWTYDTEESHWVDAKRKIVEGEVEFEVTEYFPSENEAEA